MRRSYGTAAAPDRSTNRARGGFHRAVAGNHRRTMQPDYQPQQRVELTVSSRTVVRVVALILAAFLIASILESLHQVILWVVLSIFFAIALNPAVVWFERRGL